MLNRRVLRVKVVQYLYAYKQCERANVDVVKEQLDEQFTPDLFLNPDADKEKLGEQKKQAKDLFGKFFKEPAKFNASAVEEEVADAVKEALAEYARMNQRDQKNMRNMMLKNINQILMNAGQILQLLYWFKRQDTQNDPLLFKENKALMHLEEHQALRVLVNRTPIDWQRYASDVKPWLKSLGMPELEKKENETGFEYNLRILQHVVSEQIMKDERFNDFFEERDINWQENKKMTRSLLNKLFDNFKEDTDQSDDLLEFDVEEEMEFIGNLYDHTLANESIYEEYISSKTKNWELDRLAFMDQVILKTALGEMTYFYNIPVKVSINEYIDIAKRYSTQKSKKFVNGLLDSLSQELQENGLIRKSGRGLIDNR